VPKSKEEDPRDEAGHRDHSEEHDVQRFHAPTSDRRRHSTTSSNGHIASSFASFSGDGLVGVLNAIGCSLDRRLIVLLLLVVLALVVLAPRINRWLLTDACLARHGRWDAAHDRCEVTFAP
jgi:hypothetical protein